MSYNDKHNEANGEGNRDGWDENHSWNCGVEGDTTDPQVLALRMRQAKNFVATLMLSQGIPMLTAGDEFLRTQQGNNNAWCQDNEVSWVDWTLAETNKDFLRFVREMILFRRRHPALRRRNFFRGEFAKPEPIIKVFATGDSGILKRPAPKSPPLPPSMVGLADVYWHGTEPNAPDFSAESREVAFTIDGRFTGREDEQPRGDSDIYVAINGNDMATAFMIPIGPQGRRWRRVVDTSLASPDDIVPESVGKVIAEGSRYPVGPFSLVVLVSES